MMRALALLFLAFLVPLRIEAQDGRQPAQRCAVRFAVFRADPALPGGGIAGMSKHQGDWFQKGGAKKYAQACEDNSRPDLVILWTSEPRTTITSIPRRAAASSPDIRRMCDSTWCALLTVPLAQLCSPVKQTTASRNGETA